VFLPAVILRGCVSAGRRAVKRSSPDPHSRCVSSRTGTASPKIRFRKEIALFEVYGGAAPVNLEEPISAVRKDVVG